MWLQNVESSGQNSPKITITWLHFLKNCSHFLKKLQSFFKIYHHICEFCGHFSNFAVIFRKLQSRDGRFWKIAVTFLKLQSRDCRFRNLTAICWKLQSYFELWLQLSTFCGHISNFAVTWLQILKCDRNFQHFAVTFRIMTATFNILRSHFELWLQNVEICGHISNLAVRNGLLKLMARHTPPPPHSGPSHIQSYCSISVASLCLL